MTACRHLPHHRLGHGRRCYRQPPLLCPGGAASTPALCPQVQLPHCYAPATRSHPKCSEPHGASGMPLCCVRCPALSPDLVIAKTGLSRRGPACTLQHNIEILRWLIMSSIQSMCIHVRVCSHCVTLGSMGSAHNLCLGTRRQDPCVCQCIRALTPAFVYPSLPYDMTHRRRGYAVTTPSLRRCGAL